MMRETQGIVATILFFSCLSLSDVQAFEIKAQEDNGQPAQDVVVALYPQKPVALPAAKKQEIVQKDFVFDPFVTVVASGSRINFPNLDKTKHHVYSFSKAAQFNLPLYNGMSGDVPFNKEGIVTIGCNIHDWMLAYVVVLDTPFFVKTDVDGKGNIPTLPAGHYRMKYWYPGLKGDALAKLEDDFAVTESGYYTVTIHEPIQTRPVKPPPSDDIGTY
ncbi:MAG: methylamine utilization protein [Pseudomonadota bacterium]|nr:methylamine utilization protein [Pseudomonadota bacterium]